MLRACLPTCLFTSLLYNHTSEVINHEQRRACYATRKRRAGREPGSSAVDEDFQIALSTTRAALRRPTGNTQCLVASVMTYSVGTVIWRRWTNVV